MGSGQAGRAGGDWANGIWQVLDLLPKKRGSQEQQLVALAENLRIRGIPVTYVFSGLPLPWLRGELLRLGVEVRALDFRRPWASSMRLAQWLRAARPALVQLHFVRPSSPLVAAARLFSGAGAHVLLTDHLVPHGARGWPRETRLFRLLKQGRDGATRPLSDGRLAVSRFVAERLAEVEHEPPEHVRVVEHGIDVARWAEARGDGVRDKLDAAGRPLVVCVARLAEEKGVDTALRALALLTSKRGRAAVLALVGDGPLEGRYRALAASLGVGGRVRFLGLRSDVERIVAAAEVALAPSLGEEAFGFAAAEAMAAGKPVVATRSGAMPELLGSAGILVEPGDAAGMAAVIGRLLDDEALRLRLGEAARERARRELDLGRWCERMLAYYEELVGSSLPGGADEGKASGASGLGDDDDGTTLSG